MQGHVIHKLKLQLVSQSKYNWESIALKIVHGCNNPISKARAIYLWLCDNISYDTTLSIRTADDAINRRKGVCQAYCELFYRIGIAVGLDVRIISGKSKNVFGKVNHGYHGWIAVNVSTDKKCLQQYPEYIIYNKNEDINKMFIATEGLNSNNSILIDPTWGAGYCENGKFIKTPNNLTWFNVNPYWMAFTHLPNNPCDSLIDVSKVSLSVFTNMKYVTPLWEGYGFKAEQTFNYFYKGQDFPIVYDSFSSYIEFEDIPITPLLSNENEYVFSFKKKKKCVLALINNSTFYVEQKCSEWLFDGNGKYSCIQLSKPIVGTLCVSIQNPEGSNTYSTILMYKVVKGFLNVPSIQRKQQTCVVSKNDNRETFSESKDVKQHGSFGALNFDKRWIAKKQQILQRDNYRCVFCGNSDNLTIHHTQYHITPDGKRFLPWEYDDQFLITVCKKCYSKKMSNHKTPTKITTIAKRLFD